MKRSSRIALSRIGYVTEVISENQIELTFDTEDGIEKVVYYFPWHNYEEGDQIEESVYLSKIYGKTKQKKDILS